ncbi:MAG: SRPBCC family protein [Phycisphaerae bacterium]
MSVLVTVRESIEIPAPPEAVWDYTQDYACRPDWDASIISGVVTSVHPARCVAVRGRGLQCVFRYKAFDRPRRSSLTMETVRSWLIAGGGGAWRYEKTPEGTRWTQVNSLRIYGAWIPGFGQLFTWMLRIQTRRAMRCARARILAGNTEPTRPRACGFASP